MLALDIGTSSARARVYDERGEPVRGSSHQERYTSTRGHSGRLGEFDAEELVAVAEETASAARAHAGGEVEATAISCFWHSLVALDAHRRPLTPVLTWRHLDTTAELPVDPEAVHARTGCPLHPSFWPLKIAGLQAQGLRPTYYASFPDLLTGGRTSVSMASGTGLLGLDGRWDEELLDVLGLRKRQLPELTAELPVDPEAVHARTGCPLHPSFWPLKIAGLRAQGLRPTYYASFPDLLTGGRTSVSMASGTGLLGLDGRWDEVLLVVLGLRERQLPELTDELVVGDGAAANVGCGALGRSRAALTIGTSGAVRTVHATSDPRPGLFLYRLDETRMCEGGSISDGGNLLAWLRRLVGEVPTAGLAHEPPSGLDFLPLLGGERSPGWDASRRGVVSGLSFETTPRQLVLAALEGVAHRFGAILERMPEVTELVGGGGALRHHPDWAQILADVLERPVALSAVEEPSARGAAVVALERLGATPDPAPLGPTFEPRPERFEAHRAARERQRRLYETLA